MNVNTAKKKKEKTSFTSWSAQEDEWQWFYSDVLACSERTLILFSVMGVVSPPTSSDFAYNLGLIVGMGGGALLHPHTKQLATTIMLFGHAFVFVHACK